ncbi:hypothetical protein COCSADRAFT_80287 [Bipolaris sorokiniana ND90Pr]|uniref:Uncharacterized protein n=1 Tax=Cochliobolus sativus (strain ND90Pr / ATCC 201652) TaxID=665912 RepID=M2TGT0_COCSN|nr:uncharacterized protein COCSADRAFT_80287 [Bipolaris sorokiniana ND90Pr]EMD67932.1 hypothetical protein COCSADRAFT_80287 [Bipolaris sorokiniana ND90Pr]
MVVMMAVLFSVFLGLSGMKHHEELSSRHRGMSPYYPWKAYLPSLPKSISSAFKTPSNLTIQIENGQIDHVPAKLKKTTPNFHLIMPFEYESNNFCKATLSAMLLNYPPPTVVQLNSGHATSEKRHEVILNDTLHYLSNTKLVKDKDLVLIVDAQQTWFQLSSDVMIEQYKQLLEDVNLRLLKRYGTDKNGFQKFNQTIVFGAEKMCEGDDKACKYVPLSPSPDNLYTTETGRLISETPAKFINARMAMGPASDLRALYQAAQKKFLDRKSQSPTVQSVFATLFAEQQLSRDAVEVETRSPSAKFKNFFDGGSRKSAARHRLNQAKLELELSNFTRQEFSIGLDYTHTLFQPLLYTAPDELIPIVHNDNNNLTAYTHFNRDPSYLSLPVSLYHTTTPFSRPDPVKPSLSPHTHSTHIKNLDYDPNIDALPDRNVPWTDIPLIQNTYTGAIPAALAAQLPREPNLATSKITWDSLWYAEYRRALLRVYFRAPQSAVGYHESAVGGDRMWDARGGRGGVWTAVEQSWLPWGEADGVCGAVEDMKGVFGDGKGVWLHEWERDGETRRVGVMAKVRFGGVGV